jgi:hypothetical protein
MKTAVGMKPTPKLIAGGVEVKLIKENAANLSWYGS